MHGIVFAMDTETATLICLRHAEARSGAGRQRGAPLDPPLTVRGQEQAAAVADQLGDRRARMIFASDALRSQETAAIIAADLGLHVEVVSALSEVAIPAEVLRAWIVDGDLGARVADGETGRQVVERMTVALTEIANKCQGQPVIVIGHVASLTTGISALCHNGQSLWGASLPHAVPFPLIRVGMRWQVQWPADPSQDGRQ